VPLLPGAIEHAEADRFPGGSRANRAHFARWTRSEAGVLDPLAALLFDAQTSGGLLLGVEAGEAESLLGELLESDQGAALIGEVVGSDEDGLLEIVAAES
jgi:selenide,water dikinase